MAIRPVNTMLEVDREKFTLKLWKRGLAQTKFEVAKVYKVAVGTEGHETPRGLYVITEKAKDPEWMVPDSQWAIDLGLKPGTVFAGDDPANPIKARWLEIYDGAGIHGTAADSSIGTAASHGCIRMHVPDVVELFDEVRRGTPIQII